MHRILVLSQRPRRSIFSLFAALIVALSTFLSATSACGEAMLQLFNVNWDELITKMPEIAEAGYTSLWLPPPAKAGSVFSVGYDVFDPFDLGDKNQRGTIPTRYGTKAQLIQVVETAHRFGIRVYFDNIMNHRGFDVPGYNASTPTNLYPGLTVTDFHLHLQADGTIRNWDNISDFNNQWQVQHRPLSGLIDLANESGSINENFGSVEGNTTNKPVFIRQPGNNSYYMDTNLPVIAGPWRPFNGTNGDPILEDVNAYLIRSAMWIMNETKCDGFRFDAVKHTPSSFFGATSATTDGYTGGIQTMFDYVHGYGTNVLGNGFVENNDNRNSCFDTEVPRDDAMLFGEHLGEPPSYSEYLQRGMRLLDNQLSGNLNNILGQPGQSLSGYDQRDAGGFSAPNRVMYAQSHDNGYASHRELQLAYMFMREGLPAIYSDGYNQSGAPDYFPSVANSPYLGEFGDNKMPELAYLHHQLARGGTRPRWSDADIVAFERYDYREGGSDPDQTTVLFAMNDNYGFPGDDVFVDGEGESFPSGVNDPPGANGNHQGLAVSFPPGSVLYQLASSAPGADRTYKHVTVRNATNTRSVATSSGGATIYVGGQTIPAGGGAIEILIPSGGYVMYGYQWPEASKANNRKDAITLRQNGVEAPRITIYRKDGVNGDTNFNPVYPYKMRGSVDDHGNVVTGTNASSKTYAIDIPIVTNANFDMIFRADASANNILAKLDGGIDLNSQMNMGSTNADKRDNRPGAVTDVYLGYEQTAFQTRYGPEKFAAQVTNRDNTVSDGAETYHYIVGSTSNLIVNANGNDSTLTVGTATWATHNPASTNGYVSAGINTQRSPLNPTNGQPVDIYMRAGYQFQVNRCYLYYTTDGSNPEGAFGVGRGTTKVVQGGFVNDDATDNTIDWWKATIPAVDNTGGTEIRYKIALFNNFVLPIGDSLDAKRFGLTTFAITNFNPTTAAVWTHNDRNPNSTAVGLAEGLHILRARVFLARDGKSSVYNTFSQTFYYDAAPPTGVIAFPTTNGTPLNGINYDIVIRTDASATGVDVNISDSSSNNDDVVTGLNQGNGLSNGVPVYAAAASVTPQQSLSTNYPNFPKEYRFTYANVPSSGTATITVRVSEATTAVIPGRVLTMTRTVSTLAPSRVLYLSSPDTNGPLNLASNGTIFTIRACNTTQGAETANINNYTLKINGAAIPTSDLVLGTSGACGAGYNALSYRWGNIPAGTNLIEVAFNGSVVLNDSRTVVVTYPPPPNLDSDGDGMTDQAELIAGTDPYDPNSVLLITGLENGNQSVVWSSVPGKNYQVLATTNFASPLTPISPVIQASGTTTFYFDNSPDPTNKFYRIQVVP